MYTVFCLASSFVFAQSELPPADNDSFVKTVKDLFQSGQIESEMKKQQEFNKSSVNSITPDVVRETKSKLPSFNDYIGRLKYGTHNVVSKNGEQVVILIRSLTGNPTPSNKENILRELKNLAQSHNAEAMNFMGFVLMNGLFGATKNRPLAVEYFTASAAANYQPALYNLALDAAYHGKDRQSLINAGNLVTRASSVAKDSSYRVCGFASFVYYRMGDKNRAAYYSGECFSALADLPKAMSESTPNLQRKITLLRSSISTGIDDAYPLLEQITHENADKDSQYLYCKYKLLNRTRSNPQTSLKALAEQCFDQLAQSQKGKRDTYQRDQVVGGITSFVSSEKADLERTRASNRFHYAWSVPYLPFQQQDVDLFEPIFTRNVQ
jgi:hypothetical protein